MKTRAFLILFLLTLVAGGALQCGKSDAPQPKAVTKPEARPQAVAKPKAPPKAESAGDDFIEEARKLAEQAKQRREVGTQPGKDKDPSLVPVMEFEPAKLLDVGVIPREGATTKEIKIHNKGKADLVIQSAKASCGCVKAKLDQRKKTVVPGDYTTITVTIDPNRISGFEQRKAITVMSNDPVKPKAKIDVLAKVDPEFSIEPEAVDLGTVKKGTPAKVSLVFRQLTEEPIEIVGLRAHTNGEHLELSFDKRPEEQWTQPGHVEYDITVALSEFAPPGQFNARFGIQTTCKRLRMFYCTLKAKVESFYSVAPQRRITLRTGGRSGSNPTTRVSVTADRPFEIVDLATSSEQFTAALAPGKVPNSSFIELALSPDAQPGHKSETVSFSVKTAEQTLKERIPVRVQVARTSGRPPRQPRKMPALKRPPAPGVKRPLRPDRSKLLAPKPPAGFPKPPPPPAAEPKPTETPPPPAAEPKPAETPPPPKIVE